MTEEEYYRLRDIAEEQGARSVSEFTRSTLLTTTQPAASANPNWCQTLDSLARRIDKVEQDLAQVKRAVI